MPDNKKNEKKSKAELYKISHPNDGLVRVTPIRERDDVEDHPEQRSHNRK